MRDSYKVIVVVMLLLTLGGAGCQNIPAEDTGSAQEAGMFQTSEWAYRDLQAEFLTIPSDKEIEKLMRPVILQHDEPATYENVTSLGKLLVIRRKMSKKGIDELAILRHMIDHPAPGSAFSWHVKESAEALERGK